MVPEIYDRYRKEINIAVLLTIVVVYLISNNMLPLDISSSLGGYIYKPLYTNVECRPAGISTGPYSSYGKQLGANAAPFPGGCAAIYSKDAFTCDYVGGCVVQVEDVSIDWCTFVSQNTPAMYIDYGKPIPANTMVGVKCCAIANPFQGAPKVDYRYWPAQLHKLYTTGTPTMPQGFIPGSENCDMRQAPTALLQELTKNSPTSEADMNKVEEEYPAGGNATTFTSAQTQYRLTPGITHSYIADWTLEAGADAVVNPLGKYNNKDVRCVPGVGLWYVNRIDIQDEGAVDGVPIYIQSDIAVKSGTSGRICCGFSPGDAECGPGYVCKNYFCEQQTSSSDLGQCAKYFGSDEVCDMATKTYAKQTCVNGKQTQMVQGTPKCCVDSGTCDVMTEWCDPLVGCLKKGSTLKEVPSGGCTINGYSLIDNSAVAAKSTSGFRQVDCPSGQVCCYAGAASDLGYCSNTCQPTTAGQVPKPPGDTGASCSKTSLGGFMEMMFGGCGWLEMIYLVVVIFIIIILVIVMIKVIQMING